MATFRTIHQVAAAIEGKDNTFIERPRSIGDLTPTQRQILTALCLYGPSTAPELAYRLHRGKGTIQESILRLELISKVRRIGKKSNAILWKGGE